MKRTIIHKLEKTQESQFDYEECLCLGTVPFKDIKEQVEEYLALQEERDKLYGKRYLRVKYLDEDSNEMLDLFLYLGDKIGIMQCWLLAGIAKTSEYSQEADERGLISNWLKCKINPKTEEEDWVVTLNLWREEQQRIMEEIQKEYEQK